MHLACIKRQLEVVNILLSAGALPDIMENVTNFPLIFNWFYTWVGLVQDGFTSLMLAASQKDSTDIIAALVEAKADPNVQDRVLIFC